MNYGFVLNNSWLIPGIPFLSFLFVGLFIRQFSKRATAIIATTSVFVSAFFACWLALDYYHFFSPGMTLAITPWSFEWLKYQDLLTVDIGVLVDPISVLLMLVVTIVSSLVHLYSIGYMAGQKGYSRYFTFLNLFTFSMLGVVVAPNILQLFICWELVGLSSFLLIGYYYERPAAVSASKKAFIVTRFADLFFWVGILILAFYGYRMFGEIGLEPGVNLSPFDFLYLNSPLVSGYLAQIQTQFWGINLLTLSMALVFIGAAGKSAMFPLHIWLPDAMEGPTPVSALIHAATMVVAGVYLVARLFPSFAFSIDALLVVAYVGAFTSIFAALIGCTQDDIKRILAYSTLSQIGYMMFALGVATMINSLGYTASMFHLFTHAFFKALLFLAAGAMIHAVHSNEIWDMGGLAKKMPITHLTFLIATLAISGIPPFAGFFSKDEILAAALGNHHTIIYFLGLIVGGLTAFYMFRIYFVTFWGKPRTEACEHAHDAPMIMTIPLIILAIFSAVAGFVPISNFIHIGEPLEHHGINYAVALRASLAAIIGIGIAYLFYGREGNLVKILTKTFPTPYLVIKRKFFIDEIYLFITKKIIFRFVASPVAWFDRNVVDGGVNLSAWTAKSMGSTLKNLQTGQVQTYGSFFINGAILVLLLLWIFLT
ncbi:MAG TPA: NADH-quinone oxidoreductase subunit L [Bdellovibrionota bacterium]|nr:NADH-quinone oxidoreductase subunit L [Bdellovibrionota bacterium]